MEVYRCRYRREGIPESLVSDEGQQTFSMGETHENEAVVNPNVETPNGENYLKTRIEDKQRKQKAYAEK
ncbi:hypothetical protein BIW11_02672 [Tropilaelaps mercedesae]|uniref:Uncharacterized protein n=1 Tax=Tropilaelaps mercedesae TaxID=418985 RepID=A0A1V9XZ61_9ACAR|nr:hypothetical protein BIW11_02672 [Tropilaelaps mercedesae]